MTLEDDARRVAADLQAAPVKDILMVLGGIAPLLTSPLTSEYLQKKIRAVGDDHASRSKCAALKPYLDWYLQGLDASPAIGAADNATTTTEDR